MGPGRRSRSWLTRSVAGAVLLCALLSAWTSPALARPKTDVVVLLNGDRITGEVKGLERGKLEYKTDSTGTIKIEWDDIESITSTEMFEVELDDGSRYFGAIEKTPSGDARIVGENGTTELAMTHIIRMSPIEQQFWHKFDGSLSAGLNYTHSSKVADYSFDASARYRTKRWENNTSFDFYITQFESETTEEDPNTGKTRTTKEIDTTTRADLTFQANRLFYDRWFTFALASAQHNEELGINLRLLGGYGGGRHIVRTNRTEFTLSGGAGLNEEQVTGGAPSDLSAELVGMAGYTVFRYDDPEVDLTTRLLVFPSVTDFGRVRAEFSATLKYEIFKDFFWSLSAFDSFDNRPPTIEAQTNDWGVDMSFGWTF